ncbi:GNAT family N-acetyltransferase [Bacteroides sp. 51]|uniref:GNAT family N-acetyltransferase n=1 Tax=Bacteroides sp. 51 TaxID=2302938 RepID=UPI0013D3F6EA|nr:GNAT family N-acetyltransferase [Bacteroides sp. 51]NDV82240.1 GNAT family N-acetyltransferase [Bacteroides sp. 51]
MKLKRITNSNNEEAQRLIALHSETFPEYERFQEIPLLANLIDNAQPMQFNGIYEDDELAGFFIYWDLEDSYYIHFIAVFPEMRNHKIGQKVLDWVSENLHHPVFLESEIPYNEITARRLNFYKRNGFKELANDPAILSDVREGGHPLWFMGTQEVDDLTPYLIKIRDGVYYATGE